MVPDLRIARSTATAAVAVFLACSQPSRPPDDIAAMTPTEPPATPATVPATAGDGRHDAASVPWTLRYADGSGNSHEFSQAARGQAARFAYKPVTRIESSSGTYSGGDPAAGTLDAAQVQALWQRMRALREDTGRHVEERAKGTGLIDWTDGAGDAHFIVDMATARELDAFLRALEQTDREE